MVKRAKGSLLDLHEGTNSRISTHKLQYIDTHTITEYSIAPFSCLNAKRPMQYICAQTHTHTQNLPILLLASELSSAEA